MFNESANPESCSYVEDPSPWVNPPIKEDILSIIAEDASFPSVFSCTRSISLLSTDDGTGGKRHHIVCHGEEAKIDLALRISLSRTPYPPLFMHASFEVDVVVPESLLHKLQLHEEIEVARATIEDSTNPEKHNESLFLIRGTDLDPKRLPNQLFTSIQGAMGNSCTFSASATLVSRIGRSWEREWKRSEETTEEYPLFSVSGHSLGGTATQYIATDQQSSPRYYPLRFEAYSFNGLGLPEEHQPNERLTSYTVNGDVINALRRKLKQMEAGIKIKYFPKAALWNPGPVRRHTMEATRESLCRCLGGEGELLMADNALDLDGGP